MLEEFLALEGLWHVAALHFIGRVILNIYAPRVQNFSLQKMQSETIRVYHNVLAELNLYST